MDQYPWRNCSVTLLVREFAFGFCSRGRVCVQCHRRRSRFRALPLRSVPAIVIACEKKLSRRGLARLPSCPHVN
jgi:hypothetical protein